MKKIMTVLIITLAFALSIPIMASALTVDGTSYNRNMWCAIVTGGFGKHNNVNLSNDEGHTANLIGSSGTPISSYGYWYNSDLGIDRSKQLDAGGYVNGGYAANVAKSTWQWNNLNTGVGYQGYISSPYRGISRNIDQDLWSPTWKAGHNNLVWSFFLSDNRVHGDISGLDSSDAALAKIAITGTGLPNSTSYGSSETFSASGTTSVNESVRYGNYYVSVFIPNASKYSITYTVTYMRGDRYADRNNDYNYYNYGGSGSFSTSSYYVESGGYLSVTVTAQKKGTVIVDLYKGTGVTEAYEGKAFNLYNSSGSCVGQAVTDSSGYAYFYNQSYGSYAIRPVSTPVDCYYDPSSASVYLNSDFVKGKFTLYRSTGTLKISYTTEDGLSRNNVKFKVTNPNGNVSYKYTDSGGGITISSAITGNYTVEQIIAPSDYERVTAIRKVTVYRSSTTKVTIYNPILYDFAIEVSAPRQVEQMQPLTGKIIFKNNGGKNATGIPVQVKYGDILIYSTTISIPAESSVTKTFGLDTSLVGTKILWASVNASGFKREKNMDDNYDSQSIMFTTSTKPANMSSLNQTANIGKELR